MEESRGKEKTPGRMLLSMDAIEAYAGRSRQIIRRWVKEENFPAVKVDGRWESNSELIDDWRKRRIVRLSKEAAERLETNAGAAGNAPARGEMRI